MSADDQLGARGEQQLGEALADVPEPDDADASAEQIRASESPLAAGADRRHDAERRDRARIARAARRAVEPDDVVGPLARSPPCRRRRCRRPRRSRSGRRATRRGRRSRAAARAAARRAGRSRRRRRSRPCRRRGRGPAAAAFRVIASASRLASATASPGLRVVPHPRAAERRPEGGRVDGDGDVQPLRAPRSTTSPRSICGALTLRSRPRASRERRRGSAPPRRRRAPGGPRTCRGSPSAGSRSRPRRPSATTTGRLTTASRSRIATCGWLMIGVARIAPNWPGLVIVNVPAVGVVGLELPVAGARGERRRSPPPGPRG